MDLTYYNNGAHQIHYSVTQVASSNIFIKEVYVTTTANNKVLGTIVEGVSVCLPEDTISPSKRFIWLKCVLSSRFVCRSWLEVHTGKESEEGNTSPIGSVGKTNPVFSPRSGSPISYSPSQTKSELPLNQPTLFFMHLTQPVLSQWAPRTRK